MFQCRRTCQRLSPSEAAPPVTVPLCQLVSLAILNLVKNCALAGFGLKQMPPIVTRSHMPFSLSPHLDSTQPRDVSNSQLTDNASPRKNLLCLLLRNSPSSRRAQTCDQK